MRTIRLYGELGQRFGREHRLAVRSPAEAVRALSATVKGFRAWLLAHRADKFRVWSGAARCRRDDLPLPGSEREVIRIAPVIEGAGDSKGLIGIIAGVALIVFAPEIGAFIGPALGGYASAVATIATSVGWGLVLGGVSQLLSPTPKSPEATQTELAENRPSFIFDGPVNTVREGNAVAVVYGRMRVGSQVISAGLSTEQLA